MLFGQDYQLNVRNDISQPGQFAAQETVTLKTDTGEINNLRVVGPVRSQTQVELSALDARQLGIHPPVRLSGDTANSTGGRLIGPKGEVVLLEGIIIASRHIHADPETATRLHLTDGQIVSVKTTGVTPVTFHNVTVRMSKDYKLSCHINTDESNAAFLDGNVQEGTILV
jgi:putative phosphotransacetylase